VSGGLGDLEQEVDELLRRFAPGEAPDVELRRARFDAGLALVHSGPPTPTSAHQHLRPPHMRKR
jgi:hypothetical protein